MQCRAEERPLRQNAYGYCVGGSFVETARWPIPIPEHGFFPRPVGHRGLTMRLSCICESTSRSEEAPTPLVQLSKTDLSSPDVLPAIGWSHA